MYLLNGKEINCLKIIAKRTRIDYLKKNKYMYLEDDIDMMDENIFISKDTIENSLDISFAEKNFANEIEKIFNDPCKIKSIKVLSLKEKLVIYSYYWEQNTDEEIGKALKIKGDTIRKTRNRAIEKVKREYRKLKGEKNNV